VNTRLALRSALVRGVGLAIAAVLCLAVPACTTTEGSSAAAAAPRVETLSDAQRQLNAESFDTVYTTVKTRHWDPTLGGLDWDAVHRELRPKVEAATTMNEARGVMRDALSRLGQSHFGIIDRDAYEDIASDGGAGEEGAAQPAPESLAGRGEGWTGIDVRVVDGRALVVEVDSNSPGSQAGVKTGWIVSSVEQTEIQPMIARLQESLAHAEAAETMITRGVGAKLAGRVGATLKVVFLDGEDNLVEKNLILAEPPGELSKFGNLPEVRVWLRSTMLPGDVGYIRFNMFLDPARVMPKFEAAMQSFESARGVIIDLRGNPGGIGFMANGMCGFFVDKEGLKLGEMKSRDTTMNFVIFPRVSVYSGPVAVLIDALSLSTSEIMAGGLQDLKRARIFGARTGGAALPSTLEVLPNGDRFQFVIANYVSASGRVLEGAGVSPDQEVPLDRATLLSGKDPVIEAALSWIGSSHAASNQ
jgi:carboxyl-terminal processing protease